MYFENDVLEKLAELGTKHIKKPINLKNRQEVSLYVYDKDTMENLFKDGKFKDIGNIYDYPKYLPQPRSVSGHTIAGNFEKFQRITVSQKFQAIAIYNFDEYSYRCTFLVNTKKLKKFSKLMNKHIQNEASQANIFADVDFDCKPGEYIEITQASNNNGVKPVDAVKRTIAPEKLVFADKSTISEVMGEISSFFSQETQELYQKLDIPYKRGLILYGDPGNGKSTAIREMIRKIDYPEVAKIVINPNVDEYVTFVLGLLLKSLKGRKAIIILEDLDSLIASSNRSEFLNLLDGVDVQSGALFIGTTNYPESIDPAFMNRSGRFDRTYEIPNPSYATRKLFFESRNVQDILDAKPDDSQDIVRLFAEATDGMPMASLKEVITATKYMLATKPGTSIPDAIKTVARTLKKTKSDHDDEHDDYVFKKSHRQDDDDFRPRKKKKKFISDSDATTSETNASTDTYHRNQSGYIILTQVSKEVV